MDELSPEQMGWHDLARGKRGVLRVLDARSTTPLNLIKSSLASEAADCFLFIGSASAGGEAADADLDYAVQVIEFARGREERFGGVIGVLVTDSAESAGQRAAFYASLHTRLPLSEHLRASFSIPATMILDPEGGPESRKAVEPLGEALLEELPEEARLEMARLSGVRAVQHRLAQVLIKSAAAISAAIGAQPIPLADFPILLSLQGSLVAGIMYVSGRELSMRLATEFMGAIGANVGVGMVFRETSRALLKFFPGWGNAISGAVAGTGTYAVGRAAAAYFIDGVSFRDARRLFQRNKAKGLSALPAADSPKEEGPMLE